MLPWRCASIISSRCPALPGVQTTHHARRVHATVGSRDIGAESEHQMAGPEIVRCAGRRQRRTYFDRKRGQDRVAHRYARERADIADARGLEVVGKYPGGSSAAGKTAANGTARSYAGTASSTASQVRQSTCPPAAPAWTGKHLAVVPELVERIGPELNAEDVGFLWNDMIAQPVARMIEPDFSYRAAKPLVHPAHRKPRRFPKTQPLINPADGVVAFRGTVTFQSSCPAENHPTNSQYTPPGEEPGENAGSGQIEVGRPLAARARCIEPEGTSRELSDRSQAAPEASAIGLDFSRRHSVALASVERRFRPLGESRLHLREVRARFNPDPFTIHTCPRAGSRRVPDRPGPPSA